MEGLVFLALFPAYLVGHFFVKHDPGPAEPKREIRIAVVFGVLSVVFAIALSAAFDVLVFSGADEFTLNSASYTGVLPFFIPVLIFATIEELTKFVPIALYLRSKPFFNEHTDGIIYFASVGLTFGAIENLLYGIGSGGTGLVVIRLVIALFFHGALTSIAGYFYARAHVMKSNLRAPIAAFVGVSITHALYNFVISQTGSNSTFIFAAAAIAVIANCWMFWLYYVASDRDIRLGLTTQPASAVTFPGSNPRRTN